MFFFQQERKFVVFESKLNELFQKECSVCGEKGKMTKQHIIGTAISVVIDCNCNQPFKWSSQPFSGTMPLVNLIIAGAVICWMHLYNVLVRRHIRQYRMHT